MKLFLQGINQTTHAILFFLKLEQAYHIQSYNVKDAHNRI